MTLKEYFKENSEAAVAFSGGSDSAYLLYAAKKYAKRVCGYFVKSEFVPEFELKDAERFCQEYGIPIRVIDTHILDRKEITENSSERCYYCKKYIFELIKKSADADGFKLLIDGTNASDDVEERPGMRALGELKVCSPLRLCGLTKTDIRSLSAEEGLFTADIPSYACLATRIPERTSITKEILNKTEICEDYLRSKGFRDFRIRYCDGGAKLQLTDEDFERAVNLRGEITAELRKYYTDVLLDMLPRKAE